LLVTDNVPAHKVRAARDGTEVSWQSLGLIPRRHANDWLNHVLVEKNSNKTASAKIPMPCFDKLGERLFSHRRRRYVQRQWLPSSGTT
jgi:hypothetical protein